VDEGVPIGTCLMLFGRWLQEMGDKKGFKFPCDEVQKKDQKLHIESSHKWCTFVTSSSTLYTASLSSLSATDAYTYVEVVQNFNLNIISDPNVSVSSFTAIIWILSIGLEAENPFFFHSRSIALFFCFV